jgi:hypothetical protein
VYGSADRKREGQTNKYKAGYSAEVIYGTHDRRKIVRMSDVTHRRELRLSGFISHQIFSPQDLRHILDLHMRRVVTSS